MSAIFVPIFFLILGFILFFDPASLGNKIYQHWVRMPRKGHPGGMARKQARALGRAFLAFGGGGSIGVLLWILQVEKAVMVGYAAAASLIGVTIIIYTIFDMVKRESLF